MYPWAIDGSSLAHKVTNLMWAKQRVFHDVNYVLVTIISL